MHLLDTNVLSEFAKPTVDSVVLSWMRTTDELQMAISVVSAGEIQKGISRMPDGKRQQELQPSNPILHGQLNINTLTQNTRS